MGLFTFGGGLAMLPLIQRTAVQEKGWMTDEEMVDCIAVAQSMPGVIAINAATYIGNKQKGFLGALAATLGVVMPSFIIIILAVTFLNAIGDNKYINGAFAGIKAASCGLILVAAIKLGKQVMKTTLAWVLALGSFAVIVIFDVNAVWAVLVGAIVGCVYSTAKRTRILDKNNEEEEIK